MQDYESDNEEEDVPLYEDLEEEGIFEDLDEETLTMLGLLDESYDEENVFSDPDDFELGLELEEGDLDFETAQLTNMFVPNIKSKDVNYDGVSTKIKSFISSLPEDLRSKVLVTSGRDGSHAKNSKHYIGNAVDLRFDQNLHNYIAQRAPQHGLRTINPYHGTAPHTHLEVMQMGGQPLAPLSPIGYRQVQFDPDYLNRRMQNDTQTVMQQGAKSLNSGAESLMGGAAGIAGMLQDVGNVVQEIKGVVNKKSQAIFDTANAGMDTAISILGQSQQNQELRRLARQRAENQQSYQDYTPQIKNVPIYT